LAKPNYQFEKRQKELAKKNKKEEKLKKKTAGGTAGDAISDDVKQASPLAENPVQAKSSSVPVR
jgi:hypothetical protein